MEWQRLSDAIDYELGRITLQGVGLVERFSMVATPLQVDDFLTWATLGVVLGGRLGYVLFYQPEVYFAHPLSIFEVRASSPKLKSHVSGTYRDPFGHQVRKITIEVAADYPEERITMWMGHRPALPDSLPALGPSGASPDIVYAFGHGHIGMTAAPMTGKIVADLVSGRPPPFEIAPFAPARFA